MVKIKMTKEARVWYRSAMVWFLGFAAVLQAVEMALPEVEGMLPDGWYGVIKGVCVFFGAIARFIPQPKMQAAASRKEAKNEGLA